jgi:hypothetical protein
MEKCIQVQKGKCHLGQDNHHRCECSRHQCSYKKQNNKRLSVPREKPRKNKSTMDWEEEEKLKKAMEGKFSSYIKHKLPMKDLLHQ